MSHRQNLKSIPCKKLLTASHHPRNNCHPILASILIVVITGTMPPMYAERTSSHPITSSV
ncbi:hypothetical protein PILCRDRAFT_823594 [Piloderma croceum F 1598]|uniref:Uncharacterized protein n=1 Tax=Piloderma croceum (strain F 1598) TaxID=765440 RepID=A0A0C3FHU1_PILCF|nr:hypothetical protein PILCRDRAFT_823594 [Piloderma croceum F 1598]